MPRWAIAFIVVLIALDQVLKHVMLGLVFLAAPDHRGHELL